MAAMGSSLKPLPSPSSTVLGRQSCLISFQRKNVNFRAEASKDSCGGGASSRRRNLLIGTATGLALNYNNSVIGAPVQPADFSQCGSADFPPGASPVNCCPPVSSIADFQFPPPSVPIRTRRAAHLLDASYVEKYKKAVELMKNLPANDPRNFTQQANLHCAYCDGAFDQVGFPGVELQIHNSWLFFPWHRFFLYFNERILSKLIGDDSFSLPFWNWDAPAGMQLPTFYTDVSSSLYDPLRDQSHQPPTIVDLDFSLNTPAAGGQTLIDNNLNIMYRQVISNGTTPELFLGRPVRAGEQPNPGAGSIESSPHGTVHIWTGDSRQPNRENMANFYSAARDPIFFAHHSNVDRLWNVWKKLGGGRADFTDSDWLDAGFVFFDENAKAVRVRVRDCLDTKLLGYTYQEVDNQWENAKPAQGGTGRAVSPAIEPTFPLNLSTEKQSATVKRPARTGNAAEVLVVQGIEFDGTVFTKFEVYVNASSDSALKPEAAECAGCFASVPHLHREGKGSTMKTDLTLGITELIDRIGAAGDNSVVVTLVPRCGTVKLAGISIR